MVRHPVAPAEQPRDELAIKIALAVHTPGVDVSAVLQAQRTATVRKLLELTRLKAKADETADVAWLLVLDLMIFRTESEARWLDHSETRLVRLPKQFPDRAPAESDEPKPDLPKAAAPKAARR